MGVTVCGNRKHWDLYKSIYKKSRSDKYDKKIGVLLIILTLFLSITANASIDQGIKIVIDGSELETEVPPIINDSRVMVPFRSLLESLGASVDWKVDTKTIYCIKDDISMELRVNSKIALVNEREVDLDTEVKIINDRILVPIRFIGEEMKANVEWEEDTRTVRITTSNKKYKEAELDKLVSVSSENILNTIKHLTVKPRLVGSEEEREVAKFYGDILESYGYEVEFQEFPFKNLTIDEVLKINKNKTLDFNYQEIDGVGVNLIGRKPAVLNNNPDILIVSAHYDSENINNGVIDNATGVAALIELSRLLKDIPLNLEVRFILFSGEENFMSGSRYYVSKLKENDLRRVTNINIDSIGEVGELFPIVGTVNGEKNQASSLFSDYIDSGELELKKGPPSDYLAFEYAGRPSVTIAQYPSRLMTNIDGLVSGDRIERVDILKIKNIVEVLYEIIRSKSISLERSTS